MNNSLLSVPDVWRDGKNSLSLRGEKNADVA